jgi:Asp-tRNA(Asn)/Glu-tRNA(Gln) amidotransferase A subunit family amidase
MTAQPQTTSLLASAPLGEVVAALRSGERDLLGYVDEVCERAELIELRLRSLLPEPDRCDRLRDEARALARRHPDPASRPPLFGALVGVKDIFAVEGFETRAGSMLPAESFAMPEGPAVRRLREAGALVLGKTVTTEFAHFDPGPTVNPHAPEHTPGGSSSGSAAAVAAGLAPLALGSQTVGSVIRPAAFCGVVGVKPSYGRIPTDGVLYYAHSVDHVGFFTQDTAGARLAASVLCDGWRAVDASALARPILGVPDGPYLEQAEPDGRAAFEAQIERLLSAGFDVRRVPVFDDVEALTARHRAVTLREFAEVHRERFREYASLFRPMSATQMDRARDVSDETYREGLESRGTLRESLHRAMDAHDIDLWASPAATGPAPRGLGSTGNPAMNLPWTHAGVPAVTVPAGNVEDGRPLGLQLCARIGDDERLLGWAAQVEPIFAGDA